VHGGSSGSGAASRIAGGTIAPISAAREANPISRSIAVCASSRGPMWRSTNAPCCSSVESGVAARAAFFGDMARYGSAMSFV
jgi:hypothetical protein